VNAEQAGKNVKGVALRALGTSQAGGTTEGVAVHALGPLPSCTVVETVEAAADMVARPGTAVCMDGTAVPSSLSAADARRNACTVTADRVTTIACTGGCVGPCGKEHARTFVPARVLAASAPPAVANPSLPAGPQAAGAAVSVTAGAVLGAVARAVVGEGGGSGNGNAASPLVETPRVDMAQFLPWHCTEAELRAGDPQLQRLTDANRRLCSAYSDTIHQNDGTHLDGGIGVAKEAKWQRLYLWVTSGQLLLYDLPNNPWANRFLETLTSLWIGVVERCWNSKRPLVFQAVILHRVQGVDRFHDVKPIIWGRLNAWDMGRHVALLKVIEEANLDVGGGGGGTRLRRENTTSMAKKYHNMVLCGKVRAAVRTVTNRDGGRAYCLFDLDSKSGRPIIDVLQEKHPKFCVPSDEDFDEHPGAPCRGKVLHLETRCPLRNLW
jgi:hypothetical protein